MADPMAVLVREHRVAVTGMTQGMAQQHQLAVIEILQPLFAAALLHLLPIEALEGLPSATTVAAEADRYEA